MAALCAMTESSDYARRFRLSVAAAGAGLTVAFRSALADATRALQAPSFRQSLCGSARWLSRPHFEQTTVTFFAAGVFATFATFAAAALVTVFAVFAVVVVLVFICVVPLLSGFPVGGPADVPAAVDRRGVEYPEGQSDFGNERLPA